MNPERGAREPELRPGPDVVERSRAVEDYLKAVYSLQQSEAAVSTTALAERLERSAASVTNMVKSLAEQGLLEHQPYHGVRLTPTGELSALRIIRRHRVLELYLIEKLGYSWEDVHDEAERLEHAASDGLIDRMARALGEPRFDPHGAPIPTRDGEIAQHPLTRLTELALETPAIVRQVSDENADSLRQLAHLGLYPGTRIRVRRHDRRTGMIHLSVQGQEEELETALASAVSVEELD